VSPFVGCGRAEAAAGGVKAAGAGVDPPLPVGLGGGAGRAHNAAGYDGGTSA